VSSPSVSTWLTAAGPLMLLLILVILPRTKTLTAAGLATSLAALLAWLRFGAGPDVLVPAIGKGVWLGVWISYVIAPALLLYRIATVGGIHRIGAILESLSGRRLEHLLLVAWLLPSLIQGVAGFGAPIALTAPLLLGMGYSPVKAVAYPLVGYCWSVTFGSMASSFYMASVTAHLTVAETTALALKASLLLSCVALASGTLLCCAEGGLEAVRQTLPFIFIVGVPMGLTLIGVALIVPAMATVAAAAVGTLVAACSGLFRKRRMNDLAKASPEPRLTGGLAVLAPYGALLVVALTVFVVPASNEWVRSHFLLSFDFPGSSTSRDWVNAPRNGYTPLALFGHPGTYILFACTVAYAVYRRFGLWDEARSKHLLRSWSLSLPAALLPVITLTTFAGVLNDSGMTSVIAQGFIAAFGGLYLFLAPSVGAIGSFTSGSSTSSNALLSGLQSEAATLLGLPTTTLLAAQTTGANIGNSLSPVVILVGASAVGATDQVRRILRSSLPYALVLLVLLTFLTSAFFT
jgi:lactate permease